MNERPDEQDPAERDLAERLQRIAGAVGGPVVDPSQDVRRGRARLRRRQTLAAVASAATVIVVAGGAAAMSGRGHDAVTPADASTLTGLASADPTGAASASTPTPTGLASCVADTAAAAASMVTATSDPFPDPLKDPVVRTALTSYASILASHLDPRGRHLQTAPTGFTGTSPLPCASGAPVEVGTKLSWTTHGQTGEAMVFVSVTNDWADDQVHLAFDHWVPASAPDGAVRAWEATGGSAVAVERADGTVVAIEADQTFGNNSLVGVAGFGFTTDQLLSAAADPRFALPQPRGN